MTPIRALLFSLLSVFALGCPIDVGLGCDGSLGSPDHGVEFGYRGESMSTPIEAGQWGSYICIRSSPGFSPLPKSRAILNGPGCLYHVYMDYSVVPGVEVDVPWEEMADTYHGNGMNLYYRPPPNEEVPPEGVDVAFACEVLNPITKEWDRSPDYTRRVVRRDRPMDFWLRPTLGYHPEYGPDNSFSDATVASGETYGALGLDTMPVPADDIRLQVALSGPDGCAGRLGALEMTYYERNFGQPKVRGYKYTAPADLTEPVDIVARFSILDPWTKETRTRDLTFHVVPKTQAQGD